ncbi:MAG TPA: DAK2 domain-containing protein [Clostridiales bacterium]|nr:DAK2 domain-containing protein [Clostridiales bacterium]
MINGNTLRDAIISGANNITNNRRIVDELNVFPVPDGDTGTNMSMSINNCVIELSRLENETCERVSDVAASALLRGARGNSGVILSLLFRGMAKGFKGVNEAGAKDFANALQLGVEAAYKAVMKPTEGTILTVARMASEAAAQAAQQTDDVLQVFEAAYNEAVKALENTPELLPVLKKAGVVDAGGKGLIIIFEGMLSVLRNGKIIPLEGQADSPLSTASVNAAGQYDGDITYTYCTEFIVKRSQQSEKDPIALRAYLETIGDCVVVVDDNEIIKVHVHTDHPGNAIEQALPLGQLVNIKIDNMRDQHERAKHDSKGEPPKPAPPADSSDLKPVAPEKPVGFVSVSAGHGLERLFKDLGVDVVVSGGQTMNPSTNDILRAIEATPAHTVFVLPNNKNIIMAAEQAVPLSTRKVIVLPTRTIPMGISALLAFDPDLDDEQNAINMEKAFNNVGTGLITFAARDSNFDGHKIKKDELLALENGRLAFTETDLVKAVVRLTKSLFGKDRSFVTLIYGENVSKELAEEAKAAVAAKLGDEVEITLVDGGQPVYYFIISVE